jgi:hypothetical protein
MIDHVLEDLDEDAALERHEGTAGVEPLERGARARDPLRKRVVIMPFYSTVCMAVTSG